MPHPKKQRVEKGWIEKLNSYQIFSIPVGNWLLICTIFGCIFGFFIFTIYQEVSHPSTSETFSAEVDKLWIEQHETDTGGFRVYRVRLKREENEEVTCTVPSMKIGIWQSLKVGTIYRISVSWTARGCYINEVVRTEKPNTVELGN